MNLTKPPSAPDNAVSKPQTIKRLQLMDSHTYQEQDEYPTHFTKWMEEERHITDMYDTPAEVLMQSAWYGATAVILNKLEEQLEMAIEFDNSTDAELLHEQIEFIQDEL